MEKACGNHCFHHLWKPRCTWPLVS